MLRKWQREIVVSTRSESLANTVMFAQIPSTSLPEADFAVCGKKKKKKYGRACDRHASGARQRYMH